jgi:hypothetical protein
LSEAFCNHLIAKWYKEVNLYLRGIVPLLGLRSTTVGYERKERLSILNADEGFRFGERTERRAAY